MINKVSFHALLFDLLFYFILFYYNILYLQLYVLYVNVVSDVPELQDDVGAGPGLSVLSHL